jgi:hypothetical protein
MIHSPILRMTTGPINKINDAVVGMPGAPMGLGVSKFAGQLGQGIFLDSSNILFDSSMGTVYGGHFRYVRLAAAALPVVVGQIVFWDTIANAIENLYQVTTSETGTTDVAVARAGIVLNSGWTPGNYSVIQDMGQIFVKFRAVLTDPGAFGAACFCAGAGGADLGFADVIGSAAPATSQDVSLMLRRWLGEAVDIPTNGGLKRVNVNWMNLRG